ncbi:TonB-dependent receptor plug domain-containing protein [Sphingomonas quercus]|uniref:TonB-dependent receptor n=1 Tax=Sphingomonas quercus TaxID=2842451 RepID=A0ABS6BLW0_9SPHN|nr:TonB-dependent receptor [Sphingomonas quercus]MBU3079307.1 TonB-dependent receptor [Sphingomonas quercus]
MTPRTILRGALLVGTASLAVGTALAQPAAAPASDSTEEVVVTGSRIITNGYQAPTPVTVVSTAELLKKAPESIAEGLRSLPQFSGANTGATVAISQGNSASAGNFLNLRNLGSIETLVLLDGQRLPATSNNGATDTNIIPQALVQRIDVVTGGASAAYGSDAVSGVVNYILDTKFTGIKANGQLGISSRGDAAQQKLSFAGGMFLGERLHLEASVDYFHQAGIPDNGQRPWGGNYEGGWVNVGANPARPCGAGGCPENPYTPVENIRLATATYGTLIGVGRTAAQAELRQSATAGSAWALTGYTFEPTLQGGPVSQLGVHRADLGTPTGTPNFNIGGEDTSVSFGTTLTASLKTKNAFARADYDFGGGITGFAQGSFSESDTSFVTVGAGTQFNAWQVFADNAFLPDYVRDQMNAAGVASFVASRVEGDQPYKRVFNNTQAWTALAGIKGSLFDTFRWSLNYSGGRSRLNTKHFGNFDQAKWLAASDAVDEGQFRTGMPNGNIVCRVDLTNPGALPGCTPWNPFGNGSPSAASYDYIAGTPSTWRLVQQVHNFAANISGGLFDLPAGTVNIALGAEYRTQKLNQTSNIGNVYVDLMEPGFDPTNPPASTTASGLNGVAEGLRAANAAYYATFNSTNVAPSSGKQNIKELYGELAVPLLADMPFFQRLELNGAARYVDYSVTGTAWAWKVGGTWSPIDELRLRVTKSRDIRAPTLYEMFQGGGSTRGNFNDIHTGTSSNVVNISSGNPDLKMEKGDTFTAGAVWQPRWIPGFSMSVDYYNIHIKDQITTLNSTNANQYCEDSGGTGPTCAFIIRPLPFSDRSSENFPLMTYSRLFNQAYAIQKGLDYEISQRLNLGAGRLTLRLIGSHGFKAVSASDPNAPIQTFRLGAAIPKDQATLSADYTRGPFSVGANVRYIGPMHRTMQPQYVNGLPQAGTFYEGDGNNISRVAYLGANISYDIVGGGKPITLYFNGSNLLDKFVFWPANNGQPTEFPPINPGLYPIMGRYLVVGVRVRI